MEGGQFSSEVTWLNQIFDTFTYVTVPERHSRGQQRATHCVPRCWGGGGPFALGNRIALFPESKIPYLACTVMHAFVRGCVSSWRCRNVTPGPLSCPPRPRWNQSQTSLNLRLLPAEGLRADDLVHMISPDTAQISRVWASPC